MLVAVCDDILEHAQDIRDRILAISPEFEVDLYTDIDKFFSTVKKDLDRFDAVFMDMEWKGKEKSGVDFVNQLHKINCRSKIICVTAYTLTYIEKLFWSDVRIFGVINKPIEDKSIEQIVSKLIAFGEKSKEELVFNCKDAVYTFSAQEIVCIRSDGHRVIITTIKDEKAFYVAFKTISKNIPKNFYNINKGILVNMNYVKRIEQNDVKMMYFGKEINLPVGRSKKKDFRDSFFEFVRNTEK